MAFQQQSMQVVSGAAAPSSERAGLHRTIDPAGLTPFIRAVVDERLQGPIEASVGPGRKVLYSRADWLAYLAARRWEGDRA